ncbi:MAG: NAD(P)H-dependent flavin oxidoreductase, partial [Candidatus Thorarchaeota archaeon]
MIKMIWTTRITEMVENLQYPIIMGAFAIIGRAEFAAAFSNAGGLGIVTALNSRTTEEFQAEIEKMKNLTNKPYGVNFTVWPPQVRQNRDRSLSEESYFDFVDIALEEGVKVITTSAYKAAKIGKKVHDAGAVWFHKSATVKHAMSAERAGADAVTIVGLEGTGFKNPNQNTTLVNMTMARKLIKIPLIAAGGIGNSRGFLAALAMGADAVCFGSAIMATKESPASDAWKRQVLYQDIFDEKFYKKIYHLELRDSPVASMAVGHVTEETSIKEFIENIASKAEHILRSWGITGNEF